MTHTVIAIASGKGGTGKTTVTTNLAVVAASSGRRVQVLDCDVEAPNAHLFLQPHIVENEEVGVPVPRVDAERCDHCGECGRICRFSAIVSLKTQPLIFPELCHGCGGCASVCPQRAITEIDRPIGTVAVGRAKEIDFAGGRLKIGEAMAPPLIKAVKRKALPDGLVLIDAPPGNSCPVIEAVSHADFVLLVTEPTPFGLNDLEIAVDTMRKLAIPFGVVVNRAVSGQDQIRTFCREEKIDLLVEIPQSLEAARAYSRGEMAVDAVEELRGQFEQLLKDVESRGSLARIARLGAGKPGERS